MITKSFNAVAKAANIEKKHSAILLAWLKKHNLYQDNDSTGFSELKRHFNRPLLVANPLSNIDSAIRDYQQYIKEELGGFASDIGEPNLDGCRSALKRLGRLTHTWQDFYAHSIVINGTEHSHTAWTGRPRVVGTPDQVGGLVPSSWGDRKHPGEHGPLEEGAAGEPHATSSAEREARKAAADTYVTGRLYKYLRQWVKICDCYYEEMGAP